ncbi:MAG TPA: polysaccharide biosynthesis tyrosine autokinase [Bryobacteraceae bacterium]|nr:polysaccharide biosynthesis tyrosine autokinase [Bryobacteraceae bacterium]
MQTPLPPAPSNTVTERWPEYTPDSVPPPPASLLEYVRILKRRKGALLLLTFVGGLSTCLLTLPQTPLYQARTSIEVQGINENFLNLRAVNPTTEAGALPSPEYDVQTQIRLLRSRALLERVVNKMELASRPPARDADRISAWRRALGLAAAPAGREAALAWAAANLNVRGQPNTRLIEITCDSTDPRLASDLLNTLSRELIEQNLESRWKTTETTGEWLARQMEGVRIKLEKSEEQLQLYARAAGLLFTGEKNNAAEEKLRQLQDELSKSHAERVARQSKLEIAAKTAPGALPEVLDDDSLRGPASRLTDLRRQLADLGASFTPEHPKVKRVEAQIASLEASLAEERANILRRIRGDYESARRREQLLEAGYAAQAQLVADQAEHVAHYNLLKREVDTSRQLYDSMLQRVKEASVAAALRASNIRIVEPAYPPAAPYKPNLVHNTLAGLLVGAFCGVLLLVTRDRSDRTLQEPGDARFYLGLPELGVIPAAGRTTRLGLRRLRAAPPSAALAPWPRRPGAVSESFRAATASILFAGVDEGSPRVLVLSSPAPREGKSTVTAHLAVALAETGCRVLAIDADLRKPALHTLFDVDNGAGLADLLRRREPVAETFTGLLHPTAVPNLTVLGSGRATLSETALLHSARLREVLAVARANYDAVLVDTPPMAAMADARIVARQADGVILVARAGHTSRDSLCSSSKRFLEDGTRLLGTILNDWDPRRSSRYGNDRYAECYRRYAARERA